MCINNWHLYRNWKDLDRVCAFCSGVCLVREKHWLCSSHSHWFLLKYANVQRVSNIESNKYADKMLGLSCETWLHIVRNVLLSVFFHSIPLFENPFWTLIKVMALSTHISYSSVLRGGPGTPGALSGVKTAFLTVLNITCLWVRSGTFHRLPEVPPTECRDKVGDSGCLP